MTIGVSAGQGHLVGDLQNGVQAAVATVQMPVGYSVTYAGQGQQGGSAFGDLARAMGMAVLLMYMLMMMLFGSLTLPLAVLMSLPLAMVGALGAMAVAHSAFTLFSMLGVAVLLGLVGKNAILLVDRTDRLRRSGMDRRSALLAAGPSRLRPIIMTTFSVMAALLPIASGLEEGSELLQSVALVLIGGLVTSTLLTLVFVPAMYTIFDDIQEFVVSLVRQSPAPLAASQVRAARAACGALRRRSLCPLPSALLDWGSMSCRRMRADLAVTAPPAAAGPPRRRSNTLPHLLCRMQRWAHSGVASAGARSGTRGSHQVPRCGH